MKYKYLYGLYVNERQGKKGQKSPAPAVERSKKYILYRASMRGSCWCALRGAHARRAAKVALPTPALAPCRSYGWEQEKQIKFLPLIKSAPAHFSPGKIHLAVQLRTCPWPL